MIDYVFLGTGGGMPMTFRALSSLMLMYNGRKILIDCGEGTQVQMRKYHTGFRDVDIILVTHTHGDHIFGIPGLLSTMGNSDRTEKVYIVGPKGIKPVISGLLYSLKYLPFEVETIEVEEGFYLKQGKDSLEITEEKTELWVEPFNLKHRIECIGFNIELARKPKFDPVKAKTLPIPVVYWKHLQNGEIVDFEGRTYYPEQVLGEPRKGIKVTFIGDTGYFNELSDHAKGADLIVCEGTYGDDEDIDKAKKNRHMTFREAARVAKDAEADDLIITHFSPSMGNPVEYRSNATSVFNKSFVAYDGLKGTINFKEE
ncbi:MAG: ribonuclease Z [Tissierellia bacterium]|nr:ribonuclease Z [Tissierellia bacterium]